MTYLEKVGVEVVVIKLVWCLIESIRQRIFMGTRESVSRELIVNVSNSVSTKKGDYNKISQNRFQNIVP